MDFFKEHIFLRVLGLVTLFLAIYFSYKKMQWLPSLIVGWGLIFITMESFEQLTVGLQGFSIIKKAKSLIKETKKLAYVLGRSHLITLMSLDKLPYEKEEYIKNEVINSLREMEVAEDKISLINEQLWEYNIKRYFLYITYSISKIHNNIVEIPTKWTQLIEGYDPNKATPAAMFKVLYDLSISDTEIKERIKDYEFFLEKRTHRRLENWKKCNWRTIIAASNINFSEKNAPVNTYSQVEL